MTPVTDILARAVVPEHSAPFMQAVSGGRVLMVVRNVMITYWAKTR